MQTIAALLSVVIVAGACRGARADQERVGTPTTVHVDSRDPHAMLFRLDQVAPMLYVDADGNPAFTPTDRWVPICHAPCDADVDPTAMYRVGGVGLTPSEPLEFPAGRALRVQATTGSAAMRTTGLLLSTLSSATVVAAGTLLALAAARPAPPHDAFIPAGIAAQAQQQYDSQTTSFTIAGATLGAVGVGALVTGIALVASARTHVRLLDQDSGAAIRLGALTLTPRGALF